MSRTTALHKAAIDIRERSRPRHPSIPAVPRLLLEECDQLTRRIEKARQHRLHLAANRLQSHLAAAYSRVKQKAATLENLTAPKPAVMPLPHDIHADLVALTEEFDNVTIDAKRGQIKGRTSRIVMDYIDLGRFEIVLSYLPQDAGYYEIIAEDANPAAESDSTTHPHVQGNSLCAGDGKAAIQSALNECRLLDFFLIVNRVLHTYNRDSAFTRLEDWDGTTCSDCGRTMNSADECSCGSCSTTSCYDCTSGCTDCGDRYCYDCICACADCDHSVCTVCASKCSACDETHCKGCLNDEECESCTDEAEEDASEETTPIPEPRTPDDSVHTILVEQAALPA